MGETFNFQKKELMHCQLTFNKPQPQITNQTLPD